jgi:hypothetical protein
MADAWVRRADPVRNLSLQRSYLVAGPEALTLWLRRLWTVQGQFGSLWLPDGIAPVMTVVEDAAIDSGFLVVEGGGAAAFWNRPAACAIYDPMVEAQYVLIGPLQHGANPALVLRSPLEDVVHAGARMVRLQRCRLAHDAIDLLWHSDGVVEIALTFLTQPEPRGNDRTNSYGGE